jgi:D-3-phosphoglycerate dehydrogenase
MYNILTSNIGFGVSSPESLIKLQTMANVILNEKGVRFTNQDFIEKISSVDILIAGTEKITRPVIEAAKNLKLIARVGVGVDNIDLDCARENKISICYTPEAPSESVPEFTLSLILNLIKGISISDQKMHKKIWYKPMGRMLSSMRIGIVGVGKIGSKVIDLIKSISPKTEILFYDPYLKSTEQAIKCDIEQLFRESDIVSLHLPLNGQTRGLVDGGLLRAMKKDSYLINTSRGGIVDEAALYQFLKNNHLAGAAIDVFENEPYHGHLTELDNCLTTSHIGSLTQEVRALMEEQVVEDVMRFIGGQSLIRSLDGFNFEGRQL